MPKKPKIFSDLNRISEIFPIPIAWLDINSKVLGVNQVGLNAIKTTREAYVGKTLYEIYPHKMADHIKHHDEKVIQTGQILGQEESVINITSGETKYFYAVKAPLRDEEGKIAGLVVSAIDITDRKKMEEELKLAKHTAKVAKEKAELEIIERKKLETDLKKLIQTMKLMGASIAHELRTPLRSINSCAQAIERPLLPLTQELKLETQSFPQLKGLLDLCKIIESETQAAFTIIDMLLVKANLSQVNTSKFKIFSVAQCVADAVDRYVIEDEERKLIDLFILEKDFLCKGDYVLLIHVLFNLLKNALYYIHAVNKGRIQITLHVNSSCNQLIFKDSGAGIAPEVLPHVFENFFSQTRYGTGIGLAFCKLVLTSFGGDINCRSIYGEFTEFTLTFPQVYLE